MYTDDAMIARKERFDTICFWLRWNVLLKVIVPLHIIALVIVWGAEAWTGTVAWESLIGSTVWVIISDLVGVTFGCVFAAGCFDAPSLPGKVVKYPVGVVIVVLMACAASIVFLLLGLVVALASCDELSSCRGN